ncbi:MAG: 16S rRNA (guanine(966)-N(2))-methyltransferase RsmD [Lachnospiraceae bacterium]|nr:16S rRNA (guanine(966)-N(2))-methyltransferase RsmD [Lachnospiraceae bacterium]
MRVISGMAARRTLCTPAGMEVRPTTDRIKETLFNILAPYIYDVDFLDCFAGSGGIGIEALSRGAKSAVFVDNNRQSIVCIKKNLDTTGLNDKAYVLSMDYRAALSRLAAEGKSFDYIFLDPPYKMGVEEDAVKAIEKLGILKPDGRIIIEAAAITPFDFIEDTGFEIIREKKYGSNKHLFIAYK